MSVDETAKPYRRVTLGDIAGRAGVSVATASRALNDHPAVNDETKRHVWKIAQQCNYVFRPNMPTALGSAVATIMIIIPPPQGRQGTIADPFYLEFIGSVGEAARESRCDILISHIELQSRRDLNQLMSENRADGVIFLGQSILHDRFNELALKHRNFVVWGAELPGQKYCAIGSDNNRGGRRATSHLLRMGRRRIVFLGNTEAGEARQRYEGYKDAHEAEGFEISKDLVLPARFDIESASAAINGLLARGIEFDGVFAVSDLIAMGAIRALNKAGLTVPEAVSVVGYDDIQLARYIRPALTTISQNISTAGRIMVSKLLNASERGEMISERMSTDLIVRESCGA